MCPFHDRHRVLVVGGLLLQAVRGDWGRVEEVEHERAARPQVSAAARQAGELLLDRRQVLEAAEGADDGGEAPSEVERGHVADDQPDLLADRRRFSLQLHARALDHGRREIESGQVKPGVRKMEQDSAGPAADLEQRAVPGGGRHRLPEAVSSRSA